MRQQPQYEGIKPREDKGMINAVDEFVKAIEKQTQPIGSCYYISRRVRACRNSCISSTGNFRGVNNYTT